MPAMASPWLFVQRAAESSNKQRLPHNLVAHAYGVRIPVTYLNHHRGHRETCTFLPTSQRQPSSRASLFFPYFAYYSLGQVMARSSLCCTAVLSASRCPLATPTLDLDSLARCFSVSHVSAPASATIVECGNPLFESVTGLLRNAFS